MRQSHQKAVKRSDLVDRLNLTCQRALRAAAENARARGNPYIELAHFVEKLIADERSDIVRILDGHKIDVGRVVSDLVAKIDTYIGGSTGTPVFSQHIFVAINDAWSIASLSFGEKRIRSGHLLIGMLRSESLAALLRDASDHFDGLDPDDLGENFAKETHGSIEAPGPFEVTPEADHAESDDTSLATLKRYGVDLTSAAEAWELSPVIGRDDEIRQVIDILLRRRQNNPILTGEAGVGKTAVVEGVAQRFARGDVPPQLRNVSLYMLDIGLMLAGASVKGEFERRLKGVIEDIRQSPTPIVLFIDEAHTLIGAGGASGTGDAANLLKPALARGDLRTIAATTWAEYKEHIEKDPALTRRFQVVRVEEPDEASAVEMLRGLVPSLEAHHRVEILDEAVRAAVALSHRYVPARQLPDKAISLLDTACARVSISQHGRPPEIEAIRHRIASLTSERELLSRLAAFGTPDAEREGAIAEEFAAAANDLRAAEARFGDERQIVEDVLALRQRLRTGAAERAPLQDELREKTRSLQALAGEAPQVFASVNATVVAKVIQDWTGIPAGRMLADQYQRMLSLSEALCDRVVGQDHAMEQIAARLRTSSAELDAEEKPVGVFLLCGTAGVGKTETALALADLVYGGDQNLISINMSEFQEPHTVSTLKGAPPGYVGYGKGGILTEAVRRRPYSVVLLDEIEKAHPDVHKIFYQVFDKGILDDSEGRRIDFSNTLIILTSNVGSEEIGERTDWGRGRVDPDTLLEAIQTPLRAVFPDAFLSRVVTLPFYPLSDDMIDTIAAHQFRKLSARLARAHGAELVIGDGVAETLRRKVVDARSGGRAVQRVLTDTLLPDLSTAILRRQIEKLPLARVTVDGDGTAFTYAFA